MCPDCEYLLEHKLAEDHGLHMRMKGCVFALDRMLESFAVRFPSFTDHSILHSLNVLSYCNRIVGSGGAAALTPWESYVLIMSCYLHDIGMGIMDRDYRAFVGQVVPRTWLDAHPGADEADVVRAFHNEFSGCMIRKYAELFEIPEAYVFPIVQVSRGHRKTDLFDPREYPILTGKGGPLRLPYLAAVLRLADELDWARDRNPDLLYGDIELRTRMDYEIFGIHASIQRIDVDGERITLLVEPKSPEFVPLVEELADKIRSTLAYCADVSRQRTDLRIAQGEVEVILSAGCLK